jgi:hypothetical protein
VTVPAAPERRVGDKERFWVHDIQNERYFQVDATLAYVGQNAYAWVQDGLTVSEDRLVEGARTFSDSIMPAVRQAFGSEWSPGIDGDVRVHILHHESIPGVAGYFSSTDELPASVEPHSNEREMFYVNASSYRPGSYDYLSLLAHEFQHMIHYNLDRNEPVWVNEGMSDLAAHIAGYGGQNALAFINRPDTGLAEWDPTPGMNAPHYAASYAFFAYLRAQHGDEAIKSIAAQKTNGRTGIEDGLRAIGVDRSFDEIFADWVVANRVHDNGRAADRYSYGAAASIDRVVPEALPKDGARGWVHQYATDYYDVTDLVEDGSLQLAFTGDPVVGLLGDVPLSDGTVWWSQRADGSDSRLTRAFDLSDVDQAQLRFRMWHDLEPNWDYAYFLVSTDGGDTWQSLATEHTTDDNPNGNNLGNGLTGSSNRWIDETLDLTPYAGNDEVLVRFEVITDDAVSLAGLALDDLALDAIGWTDDAETDDGEWAAEGWVRIDPRLPQRWAVQLIVDGPDAVQVHRVVVAPEGADTPIRLQGIPDAATVTVAISAMTPATRNEGGYHLEP